MKLAKVKTINSPSEVMVPITSDDKPEISMELQNKWQKILDLAARIIGVPSGLLTRLHEEQLEVFLTSDTKENIFQQNLLLDLGLGWYCENVAGTRAPVVVENALKENQWKDNPSVPFKMISYMGIPILWPDGEVFGTFCMLDNKENHYSELYKDLLLSLREIIQSDLRSMILYSKVKDDAINKESQIREVHHSVKNHFNLLISSINLQSMLDSGKNSIESVLTDVHSRISAISMIHDKLYRSVNLENFLLGDYLNELGKYIIDTFDKQHVDYNCTCDKIFVSAEYSVPCGLLLNELITNSLKHAFSTTQSPAITLEIKKVENNSVVFIYKDNGSGLPDDFNIDESSSLGVLMIRQLVSQLAGDFHISGKNGFAFEMSFPIKK